MSEAIAVLRANHDNELERIERDIHRSWRRICWACVHNSANHGIAEARANKYDRCCYLSDVAKAKPCRFETCPLMPQWMQHGQREE